MIAPALEFFFACEAAFPCSYQNELDTFLDCRIGDGRASAGAVIFESRFQVTRAADVVLGAMFGAAERRGEVKQVRGGGILFGMYLKLFVFVSQHFVSRLIEFIFHAEQ